MSLLSDIANTGNKITVIVLCIAIIVFLLVDVILVVSLHKSNNRLIRRRELPAPEEQREENTLEDTPPALE